MTLGSGPAERPKRERGREVTQARILVAAEREFAAKGFDGARLATIARVAEAPQALIHHYFGDKTGLFKAVLERVLSAITAEGWRILETKAPPKRRAHGARFGARELEALVDAFVGVLVDFYATHAHVLRLLRDEAARGESAADDLLRSMLLPQLEEVITRFESMRDRGEVAADVEARHLCISTIAMACFPNLDEAFLGVLWGIDPADPAFVATRKREISRTVLARITPR